MPLQTWAELRKEAASAPKTTFEPLPVGNYDVRIIEAEHVIASTGSDGYKVKAEVETGPYTGRKVFGSFYVSKDSPAALGIFFRQMGNLGLNDEFFDGEPDPSTIVNALIGKRAVFTLNVETYQGKQNNKLKGVLPPRDGVQGSAPAVPTGSVPNVPNVPVPTASVPSSVPSVPRSAPPARPAPAATPQAAPAAPVAAAAAPTPPNDPWAATPPPVPPLG